LAREVTTRTNDDADVLWAPCLPLASLAVPFLPLATALRSWGASRDVPVPVLGGSGEEGPAGFDVWLDEACRQRPLVLVVDDLQWADQSSLDVLMYVLAGLAARRLAVLTTVRAGEEGGPLRRWLADVRRFPGVGELTLGRLDRVATGEQIAALLGGPPHQSLIDDVYARTHGNAYLTKLLVRGLSQNARSLPAGLPTDLREAAARAWLGLSGKTRELTRLVAVAGRPQHADDMVEIAATTGRGDDVVPQLREAVDAGVLEVLDDDTYWFVHPLLAEVLEHGLLPEERRAAHAALPTRCSAQPIRPGIPSKRPSTPPTTITAQGTGRMHFNGRCWPLRPPARRAVQRNGCGCSAAPWSCGRRSPTLAYPASSCCDASKQPLTRPETRKKSLPRLRRC
jgi:hypothetical protein